VRVAPRKFTQERARKTYESLIDAAAALFAREGFDATQTPDIAAEAGVSVGTFYRYFGDKREVFLEVMRRFLAEGRDAVLSQLTPDRFDPRDRRATIEHAINVLLENVRRAPGMQRAFMEMAMRDDEVAQFRVASEDLSYRQVSALIEAICPRDLVPDPAATAYVVHTAVIECSLYIAGLRGNPPDDEERAVAALTEMVFRALFGIER